MSGGVEICILEAPVSDSALDQLASVLVECVEGGASVSFMSPFGNDEVVVFFCKVESSTARSLAPFSSGSIRRPTSRIART